MIYFLDDWHDAQGRARAIPQTTTENTSFLHISKVLQGMGVRNCEFMLALSQPDLAKYDPHNLKDNSKELKQRIWYEAVHNPWYYLREVVRIGVSGSAQPGKFLLHRGNLSMAWCYYNGIHYMGIMPRQVGKTIGACAIASHVIYFHGRKIEFGMYTKDTKLLTANVARLKMIRYNLPSYLIAESQSDENNKQGLSYTLLGNKYQTYVARDDAEGADSLGRGMTFSSGHIDEPGYNANIDITFPIMSAAQRTSARAAKANNQPCSNIYTTTAARIDTKPGKWAFDFMNDCMPWSETLYDLKNRKELEEVVFNNSENNTINGTFSHLMLGFTNEWLIENIRETRADEDTVAREYLNQWRAGSDRSLLDANVIQAMRDHQKDPAYVQVLNEGWIINWFIDRQIVETPSFKSRQMVLGMDPSEGVDRDFSSFVIVDLKTMNVIANFRCKKHNIPTLGIFIGNFLLTYKNTVFVPEAKSSGRAIIDQVSFILTANNINPFRRIFNRVVQEIKTEYKHVNIDDPSTMEDYRKYLGFMTTSQSRNMLYSEILKKAVSLNATKIYSKTIIDEMATLEVVKGRIDHKNGCHDDSVIAYLLACWLAYNGLNLHYYGIDKDIIMQDMVIDGPAKNIIDKAHQIEIRKQIARLEQQYQACIHENLKVEYKRKAVQLKAQIRDDMTLEPISQDQLQENISAIGDIYGNKFTDLMTTQPKRVLSREKMSNIIAYM